MAAIDSHLAGAQDHGDDDGDREDAYAFGQRPQDQKCAGGEPANTRPEADAHQLVGREHFAAEIGRQKQRGDHQARQEISEDQLQKSEVSGERQRRRADHGERAGLGRNDGE